MQNPVLPIFLFAACVACLAVGLLVLGKLFSPSRPGPVKRMPYESGVDPIHDARRRFNVRFHLLAIAFLVFDVELLFLYPWAVALRPAPLAVAATSQEAAAGDAPHADAPLLGFDAAVAEGLVESRHLIFGGAMVFLALLALGFIYDWRKGIFKWR